MAEVREEPRSCVQGRGVTIHVSGIADEEGGALQEGVAGSVAAGVGLPFEKSIHEARSNEVLSSEPNASTALSTQLTIIFGGTCSVFDGIPVEKVQEILRIAAAAAKATETKNSTSVSPVSSPALNRAPSFSSTSNVASPGAQSYPIQPISFCRSAADLPIARRHSLQRFLEKRRDRVVNKNPYSLPASIKTEVPANKTDTKPLVMASIKEETPTV